LLRECMILLLVFVLAAMPLGIGKANLDKTGELRENVSIEIKKTHEGGNGHLEDIAQSKGPVEPEPCATPSFEILLSLICLFGTIIILNWRR